MIDAAIQRKNMVESQVRPSDVTDRRIVRAMLEIPREAFVPAELSSLAYRDDEFRFPAFPGAAARTMLAPRIFAKLVQLAGIEAADRVLDVGSGTGYSAAVLAKLAASVVALECTAALANQGQAALAATGLTNVEQVTGALDTLPDGHGAFDDIVLEGSVPALPETLFAALKEGGRLVAVLADGPTRQAILWRKTGQTRAMLRAFDATATPLPGFARAPAFVF